MNGLPPQPIDKYLELARKEPARRINAGGQKAGLPMIITGGSARHKEFHYQFTDPGKFKRKDPKAGTDFSVMGDVPMRATAEKLRYRLPFSFCPDCDKTTIPIEKAKILGIWMVSEIHEDIDLKPGETILHCKCQDCIDDELWGTSNIEIPGDDPALDEWRLKQIRSNRMERNLVSFVRNRLLANDFSIVIQPEERRALGAMNF